MAARSHLRPLATLLAASFAAGLPGVPLARADDTAKILVAPIRVIRESVAADLGGKVTEVIGDEIHSEDGLLLLTPKAETAAPAPAPVAAPSSEGAKSALAQVEKGEGMVKRLKLKPGAQAIEAGLEDYESFAAQVDVKKVREAYIQLAVAYSRSGENDRAGEALENAVRIAPDVKLSGNYPPVFRTSFNEAHKRVANGPKGSVAVSGDGQVEIDGRSYGAAPATANDLPTGKHFLRVTRGDGSLWGVRLIINDGSNTATIPAGGGSHGGGAVASGSPELAPLEKNQIDASVITALGKLAKDNGADFVLFGGIYKSGDGAGVATHLYSARTKGATALKPVHVDLDLVSAGIETNKIADEITRVVKAFPRPGEPIPSPVTTELEKGAPAVAAVEKPKETPKPEKPIVVKAPEDEPKIVVIQQHEDRHPNLTAAPETHEAVGDIADTGTAKHVDSDSSKIWIWAAVGGAVLAGLAVGTYVIVHNNSGPVTGSATLNFQ